MADDDALDDISVNGSDIRVMWDYGVTIPLWDEDGLLPEEPDWLRDALQVHGRLIDDLGRWGRDMEELDADRHKRSNRAYRELNARGQELANRLQDEVAFGTASRTCRGD